MHQLIADATEEYTLVFTERSSLYLLLVIVSLLGISFGEQSVASTSWRQLDLGNYQIHIRDPALHRPVHAIRACGRFSTRPPSSKLGQFRATESIGEDLAAEIYEKRSRYVMGKGPVLTWAAPTAPADVSLDYGHSVSRIEWGHSGISMAISYLGACCSPSHICVTTKLHQCFV